jgi:hypothetical protein
MAEPETNTPATQDATHPTAEGVPQEEDTNSQYLSYLGELDPSTPAVLTDDMRTQKGMLLLKKGAALNKKVTPFVVKHKLEKPIDQIVEIANSLDVVGLVNACVDLLDHHGDLEQIMTDHGINTSFPKIIDDAQIPPQLLQLLTVLKGRLPRVFEKALFCMLLAMLGAKELGYNAEQMRATVIAALAHDIGFLHVDSTLLDKQLPLEPNEWKRIQSHVRLGHEKLKNIEGMPEEALRAIVEHHERCDGTGYPHGKRKQDLGQIGQLIAICDSLQAIRANQFGPTGRNLCNAKPYLRLNAETHFYEVFQALDAVLSKSLLQPVNFNPFKSTQEFSGHLSRTALSMRDLEPALRTINRIVPNMKPGPNGEALYNITFRLADMMNRSGLFNEELLNWLKNGEDGEEGLDELNNIDLMQNELRYQIGLMRKYMAAFMDTECSRTGRSRVDLREAQDILEKCFDAISAGPGQSTA